MKNRAKIVPVILIVFFIVFVFSSCGEKESAGPRSGGEPEASSENGEETSPGTSDGGYTTDAGYNENSESGGPSLEETAERADVSAAPKKEDSPKPPTEVPSLTNRTFSAKSSEGFRSTDHGSKYTETVTFLPDNNVTYEKTERFFDGNVTETYQGIYRISEEKAIINLREGTKTTTPTLGENMGKETLTAIPGFDLVLVWIERFNGLVEMEKYITSLRQQYIFDKEAHQLVMPGEDVPGSEFENIGIFTEIK